MGARRASEVRSQPGGAAQILLGRLEVAMEIVDPEELKLDCAWGWGRRLVGPGVEAEEGNEQRAGEGGSTRK
jgi:hypothetical protein